MLDLNQQKLQLENRIYARSHKLQIPVYARGGRLVCITQDACMNALVNIYNAFFYEDNWENFCRTDYASQGHIPLYAGCNKTTVLSASEYLFELIIGGRNEK